MTDETTGAPGRGWRARRRSPVGFSLALARAICARVADGESLVAICGSPGMPHENTVSAWLGRRPKFAKMMAAARAAAGPRARAAQTSSFCPATAELILERMCEGQTLVAICADPAMPAFSTVYRWTRTFPEFGDDFREARMAQAERLADEGLEVARAVTPACAYATAVRLAQTRWAAGVFAPRRYGRYRPVEAELPAQVEHCLFRHFKLETHPVTGQQRVVSYTPDPTTMQPVLDGEGPWTRLPDAPALTDEDQARRAADMARMAQWDED